MSGDKGGSRKDGRMAIAYPGERGAKFRLLSYGDVVKMFARGRVGLKVQLRRVGPRPEPPCGRHPTFA